MTQFGETARPEMGFNPLRRLMDAFVPLVVDDFDRDMNAIPDTTPDLYAFLAEPGFEPCTDNRVTRLKQGLDDPFDVGKNFTSMPKITAQGDGEVSLLLALKKDDALRLPAREKRRLFTSENLAALEFTDEILRESFLTVGYVTLKWEFRSDVDMALEAEIEDADDPGLYHLFIHPHAVFISEPFRGFGLGTSAGIIMARPFLNELGWMDSFSAALGIETRLRIQTYFELHSKGGEAVIAIFQNELEEFASLLSEKERVSLGRLDIVEIDHDGGY